MRSLDKFLEDFKELKQLYPQLRLEIKNIGEKSLWRIHVFGKDLALIGDAELLTVESYNEDEAFTKAIEKLKVVPTQIVESMAIKSSGRKVGNKQWN